jgi:hypothetical protein
MNRSASPSRPPSIRQIARELCQLFQLQIDALQQGLDEDNFEQYLQRHQQIVDLEALLKTLRHRPS